ncbi:MAG TPA: NAD+ synthase [Rickettsiales bacterium]|nr:NAD+ synthase [Rickettsiales bacterium]
MPAIAIAQINVTVGDLAGNIAKITAAYRNAVQAGADLVIFPEMCLTGYPPEDLILRPAFRKQAMQALDQLVALTQGSAAMLVGGLWQEGEAAYNAAFLLENGAVVHRQYKYNLPNYGVFDEKRVFTQGPLPEPVLWRGIKLGMLICEDIWTGNVARHLAARGAELLLVINASPYELHKNSQRMNITRKRVQETGLPLLYANLVGGQDELVFDGGSFVLSAGGEVQAQLPAFQEKIAVTQWRQEAGCLTCAPAHKEPELPEEASIYQAMVLGLKDYVEKNRFPGVVLGLSGGIDSAISAAVAVDALGASRVHAVMMPSPYTSQDSLEDAAKCAQALGITLDIIPISPAMLAFDEMLAPVFSGKERDVTEENIQSRLRGALLMAVSNKTGAMVLTTGNKSEMAVGYATLYGDMCGGYNVLKDIYKTDVYRVSKWRNTQSPVIAERIITKAPSAELRPNQTDQDSLPPYEVLDAILHCLVEQQLSVEETAAKGYDLATAQRVSQLLTRAEYKRRQAAPGVKISSMSFGRDRRYPLTSGWKP